MALDGITTAAIVTELKEKLIGGRIDKVHQPLADEIRFSVRAIGANYKVLASANSGHPRMHITENTRENPMTAPLFCMVLRKHIAGGKIIDICQPNFERIIIIKVESANEMGDMTVKNLILEIMGKHSNIIFCDENDAIIDSIKHVSSHMSSVREVLPGRQYFIPHTQEKLDPFAITRPEFMEKVLARPLPLSKALYLSLTGISPLMGEELCARASLDGGSPTDALSEIEKEHLYHTFSRLMEDVSSGAFSPGIFYRDQEPAEYASFPLVMYRDLNRVTYDSVSAMLESYYAEKNILTRIHQKSADLRRIVQTALDRTNKKRILQEKQLKDTQKKEKYRIYGELINTYGYNLKPDCRSFEALNYYTNEMTTVPLDPTLTPSENAKKYFDRYNKLKRTEEALSVLLQETVEEAQHLESVAMALDLAMSEDDLSQIKEELTQSGYIRYRNTGSPKKKKIASKPLHYLSGDGYHMYVGKNNFQNEELTFKLASGSDWWFHAKGQPGSHVIVKANGEELPDKTFEEAGRLAAYYSKGRSAPKVEIDYTQRKNLKKPKGGKPGFVIYHTNYSLLIEPDISSISPADERK